MCCSICIPVNTTKAAVQAAVQAQTPGMLLATNCTEKNICSFHDKVKGAATDSTVSLQTCEVKPMTTPAPTPNAAQAEATSTGGHLYLRSAAGLQPEEAQPAADPEHTTNATDRYNTLPLLRALIALLHALLSHSACTATARQAAAQ